MSLSCVQTRALWDAYAQEALEAAPRRDVREHLAQCRLCRDQAALTDPGLLFSRVSAASASDEDVAQVLAGVRAGIAWKQAERRLARRPARTWASVAVLVALAVLVPGNRAGREPAVSRASPPVGGVAAEVPVLPVAFPEADGGPKTSLPASATVYDWNMDSGQPRIVWIVDRSLDI